MLNNPVTPRYQIHLYYDGSQYVADVPELAGCKGVGDTYATALSAAEAAITAWIFAAINEGRRVPAPASDFVLRPPGRIVKDSAAAPVMTRLHLRFGNLNNRQMSERIGLPDIHPTLFAGAAAGEGSRQVRCAIARALGVPPSELWPDRSAVKLERDDAEYAKLPPDTLADDEQRCCKCGAVHTTGVSTPAGALCMECAELEEVPQ